MFDAIMHVCMYVCSDGDGITSIHTYHIQIALVAVAVNFKGCIRFGILLS